MDPIERMMWKELGRSWLIPRSVKEAVAFEWERGRPAVAVAILAAFQGSVMAFVAAVMVRFL